MSDELPQGWIEATLVDVARLNMGQSPPSSTYNTTGKGLPFFQGKAEFGDLFPTPIKYCSEPSRIAEPNDILISVRAPVGPTNLCKEKCGIGRGLAAIRPLDSIPSPYLLYYIRSIEDWLSQQGTGSTFTAISKDDLIELPVRIAPLSEQRRIVAKLEKLLERVNASQKRLERIPKILKRFRQSVLAAACSGKLTEGWREENRLESEWEDTTLQSVSEKIQIGPFGSQLHKADYVVNGIPVINPMHFPQYSVLPDPEFTISKKKFRELERYALRDGDIVMARRGEMGRCALVKMNGNTWLCGTGSLFIRPNKNVSSRFLFVALRSEPVKKYLEGESKGTTMDNLNLSILKSLPLSMPNYDEQQEIVRRVEALFALADHIEARYTKAKSHVDKLTQSILAKAFRGELVPQDPKDEPASVLLERIKAVRAKDESEKSPNGESKKRTNTRQAKRVS